MKAIVIKKPFEISIEDVEAPKINSDEVLIKVRAVGICGSEVHAYRGTHPFRVPPIISGHEFSGEVVKVGNEVKKFKLGDRVTVFPIISCGSCKYCATTQENLCENRIILGAPQWQGPFGEYVKAPHTVVYKIPDNITFEEGALIEPFAVGYHSVKRAGVKPGEIVAIFGAGAIGLCTLIAAKYLGAETLVFEPVEFKADVARKLGADKVVNPYSQDIRSVLNEMSIKEVDVAIDCAGVRESLLSAIEIVKKTGKIIVTALFDKEVEINPSTITLRELNIMGSQMYTRKDFEDAVSLSGDVRSYLDKLITHKMSFDHAQDAFQLMLNNKAIRIVLQP